MYYVAINNVWSAFLFYLLTNFIYRCLEDFFFSTCSAFSPSFNDFRVYQKIEFDFVSHKTSSDVKIILFSPPPNICLSFSALDPQSS